jgi:hypothetical protein
MHALLAGCTRRLAQLTHCRLAVSSHFELRTDHLYCLENDEGNDLGVVQASVG